MVDPGKLGIRWGRLFLTRWLARMAAPGVGSCYRCHTPWRFVAFHVTDYAPGSGCFPLCEWCWHELTPTERQPYYDRLMNLWAETSYPETMVEVRAEVALAVATEPTEMLPVSSWRTLAESLIPPPLSFVALWLVFVVVAVVQWWP